MTSSNVLSRLEVMRGVAESIGRLTLRPCDVFTAPFVDAMTLDELSPYSYVVPFGGANFVQPVFANEPAIVQWPFQVLSVARDFADDAELMADKVRSIVPQIPDELNAPEGVVIAGIMFQNGPGPVESVADQLFSVAEEFIIAVSQDTSR